MVYNPKLRKYLIIAFKGVMLWRVQLAGLSVVDIIVDCGMNLLFLCRI
jgi:hypothetical protein